MERIILSCSANTCTIDGGRGGMNAIKGERLREGGPMGRGQTLYS